MANRIMVNLVSSAKMFFRNKSSVFWTVFFPVVLILLFGAIFSGTGSSDFTVYVQDLNDTEASSQFINGLNQTNVLNVVMVDPSASPEQYIKDHSATAFLIIPQNFSQSMVNVTTGLDLRLDYSSSSAQVVQAAVGAVADQWNLALAGGSNVVIVQPQSIISNEFTNIDFFIPGVIGLMVMQDTINFVIGTQTRYRTNGLFRKLATTPITQAEWLISQALWQLVIVFISVATIIIVGIALFNISFHFGLTSVAMIITASILFSAMGLIIARYVKDEEVAGAAAGAITFPMMFLAGSFFPLQSMPSYLQAIASVLPLTYVNNGLRDSMIYGNEAGAIVNLAIVAVLAVVFMIVGAMVSSWKEK
jgi:ABC-2 type transport system permease protein